MMTGPLASRYPVKAVGNKEHSTVLHSIKKVEDNLSEKRRIF
jgi:chromosomal replication initiation ATPase DnaA